MKLAASIAFGGIAMMMLGLCSAVGGQSSMYANLEANATTDDGANEAMKSGYGMATFCYLMAFILFTSAALFLSPLVMGSSNEKKMVNSPQEIDTGYSSYDDSSQSKSSLPTV